MANRAVLWTTSLPVIREEPAFTPLELSAFKSLLQNGLSRGAIVEISGRRSCGRMAVCLYVLAQATWQDEICAVIDAYNCFDPAAALLAGVRLDRLLWVRCSGNAEHAIRATDLVLHAGGFGVVLLDLCETPARVLNRIPLSSWYRFRRAVEHTPGILLVCSDSPQAKSCSFIQLQAQSKVFVWSGRAPFSRLRGIDLQLGVVGKGLPPRTAPFSLRWAS